MTEDELSRLAVQFRRSLANNYELFGRHAFRKHGPDQERRSVLNASFWDVMSTGLSRYAPDRVATQARPLCTAVHRLLQDEAFITAITYGPNDARKVRKRFGMSRKMLDEVFGAGTD